MTAVKNEATEMFKTGHYGEAISHYTKCIDEIGEREDLCYHKALLLSNRAACKLKVNWGSAFNNVLLEVAFKFSGPSGF